MTSLPDLTVEWLLSSQLDDGSWIGDHKVMKKSVRDRQRHQIVYTSKVVRALSRFPNTADSIRQGEEFLINCETHHPLFKTTLPLIALSSTGRLEDARALGTDLISEIKQGGIVEFDAREEARHFDECVTLYAILHLAKHCPEILENERVKSVIGRLAASVTDGDNPAYWLWRAALVAESKRVNPSSVSAKVEANAKVSIGGLLGQVFGSFQSDRWQKSAPKSRSTTPNLFCDEFVWSYMLSDLVVLCECNWIDVTADIKRMFHDLTTGLFGRFGMGHFTSFTVSLGGNRRPVADPYMNAAILDALKDIYDSSVLGTEPIVYRLNSFFGDIASTESVLQPQVQRVIEHLEKAPIEIATMLERIEAKLDGLRIEKRGISVEASVGVPTIVSSLLGLEAKLVFKQTLDEQVSPTVSRWVGKLRRLLRTNVWIATAMQET